jgi:hypothetical protein
LSGTKLVGAVLLALGILTLAYRGFTYTKSKDEVSLGPVHFSVTDKERVNIPIWAGAGVALLGGILLARKGLVPLADVGCAGISRVRWMATEQSISGTHPAAPTVTRADLSEEVVVVREDEVLAVMG